MIRPRLLFASAAVLYLTAPLLVSVQQRDPSVLKRETLQVQEQRNASAFARMLGEFRTSLGDMLFVKTERYLDSGIAYEPHIDARQMESTGQVAEGGAHNHDHAAGEEPVKTLIRTANADFRGFIGKLERHVKPWRDPNQPHQHTAGTELLPWYRLATMSDPHNVRNYVIGAWWLKTLNTPEQREEALKFLAEGIAANPKAYELYLMKGYVLRQTGKQQDALGSFAKSAELGLAKRPAGPFKESPGWDTTDEEQLLAAMTMQINLTRDLQSTGSALAITEGYEKLLPDEGALKRLHHELSTPAP